VSGWERVLRAAERHTPALKRQWIAWANSVRASLSIDEIVEAIDAGTVADLVAAAVASSNMAAALAALELMTQSAARAGAEWTINELGQGTAGPFTIDLAAIDERAAAWAREHGGELVTSVSDETRQAIMDIVSRAPIEGITVQQQAQLLRQVVGLNSRQAMAVLNRFDALTRQGLSDVRVAQLTSRYEMQLLRQRAEMIARTETRLAATASQQQVWREAVAEGLLDEGRAWQEFNALDDACDICLDLDGTTWGIWDGGPDTHPNCRCSMILVQGDTPETAKTRIAKPIGRFPDWDACVTAMARKLGSVEAARRYCGKLQHLIEDGRSGG
jgi:hypothetical protein